MAPMGNRICHVRISWPCVLERKGAKQKAAKGTFGYAARGWIDIYEKVLPQ
jgi:hypothetical protein